MREQEQKSKLFWDNQAIDSGTGMIPGLMVSDSRLSEYRDIFEKKIFNEKSKLLTKSDYRVLEVGAGNGRWTVELSNKYNSVLSTDISSKMLELAKNRINKEKRKNVSFQVNSFEMLDYGSKIFDLIFLGACLHYMSEEAINEALKKLNNNVKEHSILVSRDTVSLLGRSFHRSEFYNSADPAIYRTSKEYELLFAKHGWQQVESFPSYVKPISWKIRSIIPNKFIIKLLNFETRFVHFYLKYADIIEKSKDKQLRFFIYKRI